MGTVAQHPHKAKSFLQAAVTARSLSLWWDSLRGCRSCSSPGVHATTSGASSATAAAAACSQIHRCDLPPPPRTLKANSMFVLRRYSMLPATITPEAASTLALRARLASGRHPQIPTDKLPAGSPETQFAPRLCKRTGPFSLETPA